MSVIDYLAQIYMLVRINTVFYFSENRGVHNVYEKQQLDK